jgi:hypothetical protein
MRSPVAADRTVATEMPCLQPAKMVAAQSAQHWSKEMNILITSIVFFGLAVALVVFIAFGVCWIVRRHD